MDYIGLEVFPVKQTLFKTFFYYYCCGWGYIVAFAKVLMMYQIYHTWIHPFHCSFIPPSPDTWTSVSTGIIFAFTCMCIHYLHDIHPPTPFPITSHPHRTCSTLIFSNFVEEKIYKIIRETQHVLLVWNKVSYIFVSMHICITTPIGSSLPVLFTPL
jgi:hypothetical protein